MHEELKNKYYYHIKANKNYFYGSENYFCYLASVSILENIFLKVFVVALRSVYGEDAQLPFKLTETHFTLIFTSSLNIRLTDTQKKFFYIVFDYNNLEYFCAKYWKGIFFNVKKANYFEICYTTLTLQLSLFHNNHYPILVFLVMCYLSL